MISPAALRAAFARTGIWALTVSILLALVVAPGIAAQPIVHRAHGYRLDLPVGWEPFDLSDPDHIAFLGPDGAAVLQVITLDGRTAGSGEELAQVLIEDIDSEAEQEPFRYQGRSASLADVRFQTAGFDVRGYMVAIDGSSRDTVLLVFAPIENYAELHEQMVSALDSFALGEESRRAPGPISQYYHPLPAPAGVSAGAGRPGAGGSSTPITSPFGRLTVPADQETLEAAQLTVDREATVLTGYLQGDPEVFYDAWKRYYRQIYRDSYLRLAPVVVQLSEAFDADGIPRVDIPHELLAWLQGFGYVRTGGLSDFAPPLTCLVSEAGDCDSLAMVYVILLHHLEFDAILMVSNVYGHAMAGVDAMGPGARFPFDGKQYLVAELTENVALGQIAADMADPAGWIGVKFDLQPVE